MSAHTRSDARRGPRSVWLRPATQIAFVALAIVMGLRHAWDSAHAFDRSCPFGGVATALPRVLRGTYLRFTGPLNLVLLVALGIAALWTGRAFCGWACPLGTVQEWVARLGTRLGLRPLRPPRWLDRPLRWLKFLVLAWVVWSSVSAVVPPLIPFCPYRTLFTLNLGSLLGGGVLLALLFLSLAVERFWCRYLCPLGALLSASNVLSLWRIRTDRASCISCGRCDRACPIDLDVLREVERGGECIRCMACVQACPREKALRTG